ncbi:MAG: ATP-binding cassette domain-containing protein, partial [bacterium]
HSPLDHLRQIDSETPEQQLRDFLGSFGFVGDQALALTGPFSGGEKSRLALALIIYQQPNLLLLDEPTNHLDLEMRLALAQALQSFEGAMVIVSHDRHLLRVATDTLLLVDQGSVTEFKDDLDGYPAWLAKRARVDTGSEQKTAPRDRKAEKRESAERRKALAPLTRRVSEAERDLEAEQQRLAELEGKLADPAMYKEENKAELQKLLADKRSIDARCEQLEQEWMEASEALESRQAELS